MQISESHCGPAVIQMMLSNLGFEVTQEAVAEAGGATSLIAMNGMRIDQLALAVHRLVPEVFFYFKDHATIDELVRVVNDYRYPAGVEWQGVFEDEDQPSSPETKTADQAGLAEDSESEDNDYGHYSLVIQAYRRKKELMIADPYKDYFSQTRIFDFRYFEGRWYDYNEVSAPVTGQPVVVEDYHMMFVIVRRNILFPRRIGMRTFTF